MAAMQIPQVAKKPSMWIALISGGAALAQTLTAAGDPHLVLAGLILSAIFKVAEAASESYINGKKLEVEKQFVTTTGNIAPSVLTSAKAVGLTTEYVAPAVTLNGPAPGVPAPPVVHPTADHVPQA